MMAIFNNKGIMLRISILILCIYINSSYSFQLGLENITEIQKHSLGKIGLITNQTGVTQDQISNLDILLENGFNVSCIYAPEHGFKGIIAAGDYVANSYDEKTSVEIMSLYRGDKDEYTNFSKEALKNIDAFIFDMQDSGMRHYTYISIMYEMMKTAEKYNKKIIILDRPNPLGLILEGPTVDKDQISFVGIAQIPLRHGLTVGEIALYFNKYCLDKPAQLNVIPMKKYRRNQTFGEVEIPLSPNIAHIDSCYGYSFLCLLSNMFLCDVDLDKEQPFRKIIIPNQSLDFWESLKNKLIEYGVESYTLSKDNKILGVSVKIKDINSFSCSNLLFDIIELFTSNGIMPVYTPIFSRLIGTLDVKKLLEGKLMKKEFVDKVNNDIASFNKNIHDILLYLPVPNVKYLKA